MTTMMYGISNCDTIKKAKTWLTQQNISFTFHDYRKDGITQDWLEQVEAQVGWETLLNKRGTTFRQLSDEQKQQLNKDNAIQLMLTSPAMIKRPLLVHNNEYVVGFKADHYAEIFA